MVSHPLWETTSIGGRSGYRLFYGGKEVRSRGRGETCRRRQETHRRPERILRVRSTRPRKQHTSSSHAQEHIHTAHVNIHISALPPPPPPLATTKAYVTVCAENNGPLKKKKIGPRRPLQACTDQPESKSEISAYCDIQADASIEESRWSVACSAGTMGIIHISMDLSRGENGGRLVFQDTELFKVNHWVSGHKELSEEGNKEQIDKTESYRIKKKISAPQEEK